MVKSFGQTDMVDSPEGGGGGEGFVGSPQEKYEKKIYCGHETQMRTGIVS